MKRAVISIILIIGLSVLTAIILRQIGYISCTGIYPILIRGMN